jgi:hypothetical protein
VKPPLTDEEIKKEKQKANVGRFHSQDVSIPRPDCIVQIGQVWERKGSGSKRGAAGDRLLIIAVVDRGGDQHAVAVSSATKSKRRIGLGRFVSTGSDGLRLVPNVVDVKGK